MTPRPPQVSFEAAQMRSAGDALLVLIVLAAAVMLGVAVIPIPTVLRLRVAPSQIVAWRVGFGAVGASVALGYLIALSVSGGP